MDALNPERVCVQVPAPRAGVEAYVHTGIAPATKRVCCADLDHLKRMVATRGLADRLSIVGAGRDGSSECGGGIDRDVAGLTQQAVWSALGIEDGRPSEVRRMSQ
jgi:hypothetical protein